MPAEDNVVYVGKKGIMSYVLAAITQFNQGSATVSIKARGKSISRAVDVAEILRNKFMAEVKIQNIAIHTEELANEDGTKSKVSSIDITLTK
jgi:DNA-binding protein